MDWYPAQFFNTVAPPSSPFALIVLNQPINQHAYRVLDKHARFTICADGGANHLYNLMRTSGKESTEVDTYIQTPKLRSCRNKLNIYIKRKEKKSATIKRPFKSVCSFLTHR
ncbi:thiamine pyrophosphokinase Thi80 [Histoplasma capsulatum var. duboisii H88]|uniref:Thiamine pyrophosphokinase Thi80 n=1 Tax=Ajellomyces capsulatus (strain H88) TaxID=544711 RepID=A0A8A1LTR5_AJEC8|nr:thiamine pyrophosphokinase Thi80 [Histoplasma capsulatum var. duboisii H88]